MKYKYFVKEDHYKKALKYNFQEKIKLPGWIAVRFLCSVGQLLLSLAYVADGAFTGKYAYYLLGASLLLFGLSMVYFHDTDSQAAADFRRMKKRGRIPEGFWKQHTLSLSNGSVRLKYGGRDILLDNWLTKTVRFEDVLLLLQGSQVVDVIPLDQLNGQEAELERLLNEELAAGSAKSAEEARGEFTGSPRAACSCSYTPQQYFSALCHAERRFYLSRYSVSPAGILLTLLTIGVIIYISAYFSLVALLIGLYVCLFLNMRYFIVFTPLIKLAVRRNMKTLPAFVPGESAEIRVWEESVELSGRAYCVDVPESEIRAVLDIPEGLALRTAKGSFFIITKNDADAEGFLRVRELLRRKS